jgi:hypothetical protein
MIYSTGVHGYQCYQDILEHYSLSQETCTKFSMDQYLPAAPKSPFAVRFSCDVLPKLFAAVEVSSGVHLKQV